MLSLALAASAGWPTLGTYDIVVIGGGPAGVGAAVAAGRRGKRVLLVESYGFAGGTGTQCCVPMYYGFGVDGEQSTAGLSDELVRRMDRLGAASLMLDCGCAMPEYAPIGDRPLTSKVQMDTETQKLVLRRMLEEAGVDCLFYAHAAEAVVEGGKILAALVSCLEGPRLVFAEEFIDCTGDARFAALVSPEGVEKLDDDYNMHKSMFFFVGGVRLFREDFDKALYQKLYREGKVPGRVWEHFGYSVQMNPEVVQIAMCYAVGDGVDSRDMSRMDRELREDVHALVAFLREYMPGFQHCYLLQTSLRVGVRAGQLLRGAETVTEETLFADACPTTIARCWRTYGAHSNAVNRDGILKSTWGKDAGGMGFVPMGAVVSRTVPNLFAAGRCISAAPPLVGTIRMMNTCMTTGEAAGLLAAVSMGRDAREVKYSELRPLLEENGFIL